MFRRSPATRGVALTGIALLASVALAACGSDDSGEDPFGGGGADSSEGGGSDSGGEAGSSGGGGGTITVGSANFPESELLMQMYAQVLEEAGVEVETTPNIGAREIYIEAFEAGDINLLPEYNGALLSYFSPDGVDEGITSPEDVYDALQDVLPEGSQTLPQSDAEDKDTLTVTQETADEYGLSSIEDLPDVAGELVVGAGPEFRERFQGLVGLEEVYGVTFEEFRPLDAGGPLTVAALADGTIDVANIFSTDSSIATNGWVVLDDPQNLYLSQNIVPFIKSDVVTPEVEEALNGLSEVLTTDNLTEALARVQVDTEDPVTVAADFLEENGLS